MATMPLMARIKKDAAGLHDQLVQAASDYVISGLAAGTQYWCRVRPVRGGTTEAWSDPATRVAPV